MAKPDVYTRKREFWGLSRVRLPDVGPGNYIGYNPAGDNPSLYDPNFGSQSFGFYDMYVGSLTAATTTSQTIKLVRIVPAADFTAAAIVSISGAAAS